jgi:hypothetical protein
MNQEFKEEWIAALESDEYKQGQCMLKTKENQYCCLGVASHLLAKKGILIESVNDRGYPIFADPLNAKDHSYETLPVAAQLYMDVSANPLVETNDEGHISLAELNDGGKTFKEIAAIIREQL